MAVYRCEAQIIGRSSGRSATAAAAYRSASRIVDERTGLVHDYTRKGGVLLSEIVAPADTPAWMLDRAKLWNGVEAVEKRKDAQLSRELLLNLPHELDDAARRELVLAFVRDEFVRRGMIADVAIHLPHRQGDDRNHHAHVMLTLRSLTGDGFGAKARDWNDKALLEHWREEWANRQNRALEQAGRTERVDHRSLEDQGIDREPEPKQGPVATDMERKGKASNAGDDRRATKARNAERDELHQEAQIIDLELERIARQEQAEARQAQAKADAAGQQLAAREEAERGRREESRIARERDRFGAWANGKRAELQSAQLDATGEQGRTHALQRQELDAKVRAEYGPLATRLYAERNAILARQTNAKGLRGLAYRLTGRAAKDAARAAQLMATITKTGERALERMDALAARQARQVEALSRRHARDSTQLEQRIENGRARREQEGWKGRDAAKGKEAGKGGKDRQQPAQQRQPVRREATTGREIKDSADTGRAAENSPVDAVNDPGHETTPEIPDATHGPELGQGEAIPERQPWTPEDRAARIEAERQAREDRDRGYDADPGREI
jgi:hypothetical protein